MYVILQDTLKIRKYSFTNQTDQSLFLSTFTKLVIVIVIVIVIDNYFPNLQGKILHSWTRTRHFLSTYVTEELSTFKGQTLMTTVNILTQVHDQPKHVNTCSL